MAAGRGLRRRTLSILIAPRRRNIKAGPSLRAAKVYVSCVQLPDGSVLELGGGSANKIENASQEVSLLKTPTSKSWTAMNPLPKGEHRLYHSMAFLADDGSVISFPPTRRGRPGATPCCGSSRRTSSKVRGQA